MKKTIVILLLGIFALSAFCYAEEIVTTKDGKQVLLKDDKTWEYVESEGAKPTPVNAKYAEEAVEVWKTSLFVTEVNYSDVVGLYLNYQNKTAKKVIGVSVYFSVTNPFGKLVVETTYDDEVVIEPLERLDDHFVYYEDNPFIEDEPYDKLLKMAQNGTGKISTKITQVIFEDGTILKAKPVKK